MFTFATTGVAVIIGVIALTRNVAEELGVKEMKSGVGVDEYVAVSDRFSVKVTVVDVDVWQATRKIAAKKQNSITRIFMVIPANVIIVTIDLLPNGWLCWQKQDLAENCQNAKKNQGG